MSATPAVGSEQKNATHHLGSSTSSSRIAPPAGRHVATNVLYFVVDLPYRVNVPVVHPRHCPPRSTTAPGFGPRPTSGTSAVHLFRGRERTLHPRYAALASHDPFTPKFCLPVTPAEKPRVGNRVFDLQRQWATPVPQVADLAALNAHLRGCCVAALGRTCGDNAVSVGVRFEQDAAAALPVPGRASAVTPRRFPARRRSCFPT